MHTVTVIIANFVLIALGFIQLAMLVRAILSLLGFDESGTLGAFLALVTEPVILPARILLSRVQALDGFPLDFSFLLTYFLLTLISGALPAVA